MEFNEQFIDGIISFEQDIQIKQTKGSLGIQVSEDGKVWVCIDGQALIRFKPDPLKKATLLSCPFCGNKPNGLKYNGEEYFVECERCLFVMEDMSQIELINRWNTRNGNQEIKFMP